MGFRWFIFPRLQAHDTLVYQTREIVTSVHNKWRTALVRGSVDKNSDRGGSYHPGMFIYKYPPRFLLKDSDDDLTVTGQHEGSHPHRLNLSLLHEWSRRNLRHFIMFPLSL